MVNDYSLSRRKFLAAATALSGLSFCKFVSAATSSRRIGLVDDNLDNFHTHVYLPILRDTLRDRGFVVAGATALQADKSRSWAEQHKLPYFDTVEQLNQTVDCFIVLSPSAPQLHWQLCEQVLPCGKPTFVDKTFAPDLATAEKIFALADKHQVALQTSSALRYTNVQKYVKQVGREHVRHAVTWGGGSNYDEYAIHPVEMAISILGPEVVSLMRRGAEPESQLLLNFNGGRTAVVNIYNKHQTPFAASVTTDKETKYLEVDSGQLFVNAAVGMLDFFAAGKALIDRRESLAIMHVLDVAKDPAALERPVTL